MLTLSTVSSQVRQFLKWGGIVLGIIFVLFILYKAAGLFKNVFFPEPPPPPTVEYGKLPAITFPKTEPVVLNYSVDTVSGSLPIFEDRAKVFKMEESEPDLLAVKKAEDRMSTAGFDPPATPIDDELYQWRDKYERTLIYNVSNLNFTLSSQYLRNDYVITSRNLNDLTVAVDEAKNFLVRLDSLPKDIDDAKTKTNLFAIKDFTLSPATSISNANLVQVNLFQKDVDELPVYYPNPSASLITVLVGGGLNKPEVVEVKYMHQSVSEAFSTYPIKTAEEAYEELKKNQAYVIYGGEDKNITIKEVFLAYYMSDKEQKYLMPIIIFKGDNGYTAYVSAIKDEWINK